MRTKSHTDGQLRPFDPRLPTLGEASFAAAVTDLRLRFDAAPSVLTAIAGIHEGFAELFDTADGGRFGRRMELFRRYRPRLQTALRRAGVVLIVGEQGYELRLPEDFNLYAHAWNHGPELTTEAVWPWSWQKWDDGGRVGNVPIRNDFGYR